MSNFLIVNVDRGRRRRLTAWLDTHSDPTETVLQPLEDGWWRCFVAAGVDSCLTHRGFFRGVAVTDGKLHFQQAPGGDLAWGAFISAEVCGDALRVRRDVFGMVPMFSTSDNGFSAVSDSVLLLASLRRALDAPLTADHANLRARSILHLASAQTVSSATHFQEISAVAAGREVRISHDRVDEGRSRMPEVLEPAERYPEAVRQAAEQLAGTVSAMAQIEGWSTELAMSGGLDSRLLLAAAHRVQANIRVSSRRTTQSHQRDFAVAERVAAEFSFAFAEDVGNGSDLSAEAVLAAYGTYTAGVYDRVGGLRQRQPGSTRIHISGAGIGAAKGAWGWRPWRAFATSVVEGDDHASVQAKRAFERAGARALLDAGFDPESPSTSETFYALYRLGLHSGASLGPGAVHALQPLASPAITAAGRAAGGGDVVLDLTLLLSPEMTVHEYDRPGRGLTKTQADQRLRELGGLVSAPRNYEVVGRPEDVPVGASQLSLSVARSLGFTGEDPRAVLEWFSDDIQRLPGNLQQHYRRIYDNGVWMLGKADGHVASAGPSLAKAAGLRVLAALD